MNIRVHHNDGDACAVVHIDNLVITASHGSQGYELLVEVDGDEGAASVPVSIDTASGQGVKWEL
jgi:hypothetical protein